MSVGKINISDTVAKIERGLASDSRIPAEFRALVELLLMVVKLLVKQRGRNSDNSSTPPSLDPNRKRGSKRKAKGKKKKPGGQPGHDGVHLEQVKDPDVVETIEVDRKSLPKGKVQACWVRGPASHRCSGVQGGDRVSSGDTRELDR